MDNHHDPYAAIIFECITPPEAEEALRHAPAEIVEPSLSFAICSLNCQNFPTSRNPDNPWENQMLAESPVSPIDKGGFSGTSTRTGSSSIPERLVHTLDNFIALVKHFSQHSDKSLGDKDILEVAKSKGISFPPPKWWRPGGYERVP